MFIAGVFNPKLDRHTGRDFATIFSGRQTKTFVQSKKIGTKIKNQMQACIVKGVRLITLEVRTTNDDAIKFYGKFGFNIVHMIPDYYKDRENGYIMHKTI